MKKNMFNSVTKVLCTLYIVTLSLLFTACRPKEQAQSFQYNVDKFYDLEILRYDVPEFDSLSLQQKQLVYCLSEAALWGRDILFDQNGRYNLRIRRTLEALYEQMRKPENEQMRNSVEFLFFEKYLKRVWFSNGIHHHYSEDKFMPEFSQEWFVNACAEAGVTYDPAILPVMFDPAVMPKRTTAQDGVDLVANSAGNYYGEGVTQAEAEAWYAAHKDDSPEPMWIGLNSQLVKNENGEIEERVYKVGGLYGEALEHVVYWLKQALQYAENDAQKLAIEKMISFNETGDLKTFNEYCIAWVRDLDSRVDASPVHGSLWSTSKTWQPPSAPNSSHPTHSGLRTTRRPIPNTRKRRLKELPPKLSPQLSLPVIVILRRLSASTCRTPTGFAKSTAPNPLLSITSCTPITRRRRVTASTRSS